MRDECDHGSLRRQCEICDRDARIADLEAALCKINALIDSPARFNAEVQAVLDSVIDTSDVKLKERAGRFNNG